MKPLVRVEHVEPLSVNDCGVDAQLGPEKKNWASHQNQASVQHSSEFLDRKSGWAFKLKLTLR